MFTAVSSNHCVRGDSKLLRAYGILRIPRLVLTTFWVSNNKGFLAALGSSIMVVNRSVKSQIPI